MANEESLRGADTAIDSPEDLARAIDQAFDYRGDVTIEKADGSQVVGYLFNRNAANSNPFAEVIETESGERLRLLYADIKAIRFTGKDAAAGQSWEAWQRRRESQAQDGATSA